MMKELTGKEVAELVINHVKNAKSYEDGKIGRYSPDVPGKSWKSVPNGRAWISNFDVENLWNSKDMTNLKPQCYKIIDVLKQFVEGIDNKTINKAKTSRKRVTFDLNDYYKVGDIVHNTIEGFSRDKYDYMLVRVSKVNKTSAEVDIIPNNTNINDVLSSIKYYGEQASWTRTYDKETLFNDKNKICTCEIKARDLGVRVFKGKIRFDDFYKCFDVEKGEFTNLGKEYLKDDRIVLKNDKYWYD